jgi:hypothetical protein
MLELAPSFDELASNERAFWQPIGQFVFAFGRIENQIDWCISALLQADDSRREPSVASQIRNLCSRIALVEALFQLLTTERKRRAELQSILRELRAVTKFRNGLLHGPWGAYSVDQRSWKKPRTDPTDLSPGSFEVTIEQIDEQTRRAVRIGEELSNLVRQVAEQHATGLSRRPEAS